MPYDPTRRHRGSIRLRGYDYTTPGIYFVTICAAHRICVFDHPALRRIAETQWQALSRRFAHVTLDAWVVMPNHVHGLLLLDRIERAPRPITPKPRRLAYRPGFDIHPAAGSLGAIVRAYKAAVSLRAARVRGGHPSPLWQRGYWERVVRDDDELDAIRRYIEENPRRWAEDRDNLDALLSRMVGPVEPA